MSKGLEALESLFNAVVSEFDGLSYMEDYKKDKNIVEKELKALEIIKEMIKIKNYGFCSIFDKWFIDIGNRRFYFETQEEYDLLKEVLL